MRAGRAEPRRGPDHPSLGAAIFGHALVRLAAAAGAVLVGLVLASAPGAQGGAQEHASLAALSGWLGGSAYAAELLASLPLGVAADVAAPGALMAGGALASALALLLFALSAALPLWFASRLLSGAAAAAVTPPLLAVLSRSARTTPLRRARLMSLFELSMLAGIAAGPVLGAQLWAHAPRAAFEGCALLCLPAALLLYRGARDPLRPAACSRPHPAAPLAAASSALRAALAEPSLRRLAPAWLAFNIIVGLWLAPTVTYLLSAPAAQGSQYLLGLYARRPGALGWLYLGYAGVFAAGLSVWAAVLGRIGAARTLRISLLAMLAVTAVLFELNRCQACLPATRSALVSVAALLVMIESGFTPAALSALAASLSAQQAAGAAMGIYTVLFSVGGALGALLAGVLGAHAGMDGLLAGTAALAVLAWLSLPRLRSDEARCPA